MYDWSEGGDTEVVVEDIERLNMDYWDKYDKQQKDWRMHTEVHIAIKCWGSVTFLCGSGFPDLYLLLMDPDPTPDLTPLFSDRMQKIQIFSYFL
jgi:hypothetical protein